MTPDDVSRQLSNAREELVREFRDRLPADEVAARFDEIAHRFDDAPVRTFVPVLAGRETRARLRELTGA